jgi:hypothetical protein
MKLSKRLLEKLVQLSYYLFILISVLRSTRYNSNEIIGSLFADIVFGFLLSTILASLIVYYWFWKILPPE